MFSYYGSKSKLVKYYPKPLYSTIIEPFAGSAHYSLRYADHNVILNEKYSVLCDLWQWLIQQQPKESILKNLDFYVGQDIRKLNLKQEHKNLIGFLINRGSVAPRNIVQKWSCQVKFKPKWASTVSYTLKNIARRLESIKHWKISEGDYKEIPNQKATWFIDPPYMRGGDLYKVNDVDYSELASWCKSRKGQVLVCGNSCDTWLPFKPLKPIMGQKHKTLESLCDLTEEEDWSTL